MAFLGNACIPNERLFPEMVSSEDRKLLDASPVKLVRRIVCIMFIGLLSSAGLSALGQATNKVAKEYDLKAAVLPRFATYVEWPTNAFPDPNTPITIGVLGTDPFGKSLEEVVRGQIVQKRNLAVENYTSLESMIKLAEEKNRTCHILFISQSESLKLGRIFAALEGRHILTVGEGDRFCQSGGIIQLVIVENKVRFFINQNAAKTGNLKLSAALLDLAEKKRRN